MAFLEDLFAELGARRRRLRAALGDRGQSLFEFGVLSAFALGSFGLFIRAWMPAAAPWGFALPFVFAAGYAALDWRRQRAAPPGEAAEAAHAPHDRAALAWTLACAGLALAAFVLALLSAPPAPPPPDQGWTPPDDTVTIDLSP